jgi:NADH:ubiquinone oxidoreductase subunit 2 (subunit N)
LVIRCLRGFSYKFYFFFAVISKLSIFVLLVRLCYTSFFSLNESWQFYSVWVGVFSIFVGSFGGLKQRKLKTLLAYSSTSHMGYALIAFSTSTHIGIQMLLFYLIIYIIAGLATWFIILLLRVKTK